jgi:hypothetical protein
MIVRVELGKVSSCILLLLHKPFFLLIQDRFIINSSVDRFDRNLNPLKPKLEYLGTHSVPQREHRTSPLQRSTGKCRLRK